MKPILEINKISKRFRISHETQPYLNIRDRLSGLFSFRKSSTSEEFWALQDITFNIGEGDSVGIIGKNGAGKSTLLKILSRITPPTSGKIISRGRIASLLEVGTGFHPELSGRENIFLNGSILGMKRKEITDQFDEIVDFSGVEKFLDTPLKHYSSGMQLRLAFAVAAFLNPEILIIDEVLAVGDAEFQKRCMNRMRDLSTTQGKTILLVSHNMVSIKTLCTKAVFLDGGRTEGIIGVNEAIETYLFSSKNFGKDSFHRTAPRIGKEAFITEASLTDEDGNPCSEFYVYKPIVVKFIWENATGHYPVIPNLMLVNQEGTTVLIATDAPVDFDGKKKMAKGIYESRFVLPANFLNANYYQLNLALDCGSPRICFDSQYEALRFSVTDPMDEKSIARGLLSSVRSDAALWPALECSFRKLSP